MNTQILLANGGWHMHLGGPGVAAVLGLLVLFVVLVAMERAKGK